MKLPYFRWFPSEAEVDEDYRCLSLEEIGLFHHCLNWGWIQDGLPEDTEAIRKTINVSKSEFNRAWPKVSRKFELVDGRWRNKRQEEERIRVKSKSDKNSANSAYGQSSGPGHIYLVQRDNGQIKIGSTENVARRIAQLKYKYNAQGLKLLASFRVSDMRESETSLHREYEGKRATGEWFALSREDVSKIRITLGGDKSITDTGDSKGDNKYHPALRAYDSDSISGLGVQGEGVDDIVERVIALHPNKTYPDYARHAFVELIETAADPTAEARKIEAAHKLWVRYWRDHFDDERFVPKLHEFLRGGTWKNSPPNISRNSSQPHPAFIRSAL